MPDDGVSTGFVSPASDFDVVTESPGNASNRRISRIRTVHDVNVQVGLRAVSAVAALRDGFPCADRIPGPHAGRAPSQMAQEHELLISEVDHDLVSEGPGGAAEIFEQRPRPGHSRTVVVVHVVHDANDCPVRGREHGLAERDRVPVAAGRRVALGGRRSGPGVDGNEIPGEIRAVPAQAVRRAAAVPLTHPPVALEREPEGLRRRRNAQGKLDHLRRAYLAEARTAGEGQLDPDAVGLGGNLLQADPVPLHLAATFDPPWPLGPVPSEERFARGNGPKDSTAK